MAKGAKLKAALDRFQGVDHKLERQKKQQKEAEKKRRAKGANGADDEILEGSIAKAEKEVEEQLEVPKDAVALKEEKASKKRKRSAAPSPQDRQEVAAEDDESEASGEEWETDESENEGVNLDMIDDSEDSDSEEDEEDGGAELDEEEEEDIPMSDIESLASEDKGDIIPYQRLTINNTAALLKAHKSIALPSNLSFSQNQTITTDAPVEIPDIDDDLNRELAFYKQSLEAVTKARGFLKAEGVSFSRPTDYFAEMVKSDEHMGKIKQKLIDEAASKRASADARRQRDLKKFGKQVQVAKLQERDRAKRDTMEKINLLKRKRQGADIGNANEENMFDVALEDAAVTEKKDRAERRSKSGPGRPNAKRAKRDEKYGFGGKKRFAKSNDAESSADTRAFSVRKMKGGKKGGASRPGKSKRAART